jgi:endonuclease/exonuclease/phosphatase family metal-dependent hydrolase
MEKGRCFTDLCAMNQLVIKEAFTLQRIDKVIWTFPDHVTENQIEHICRSEKLRRSGRDVRMMTGADVSSDHRLLVIARLRLKRLTNINNNEQEKFNIGCSGAKRH